MNPKQVMANEQGGDLGQKWLTDNEAGSGPFKIKRWQQGVLHRSRRWTTTGRAGRRRTTCGGVIYRSCARRRPAARRCCAARSTSWTGCPPDDYDPGRQDARHRDAELSRLDDVRLKINSQKAPTSDINLRKAIAYAFDYDALLTIYNGDAALQTSPFPNATRGHIAVPGIPRKDLDKAKEFLAKSAYANGGIELEYVYVQGLEEERKIGLVLLDNLRRSTSR